MAINFIKNMFQGKIDESTHLKFTRFGKGVFEKEDFIFKITGKNVQIQTGYEYIDVLIKLLADNTSEPVTGSGKIVSSKNVEDKIKENGVEIVAKRGKKYDVKFDLSPENFRKFVDEFDDCYLLLNVSSGNNQTKMKQTLPKPNKLVEKFATVKYDKSLLPVLKEEFLFDIPEFKKEVILKHTYDIKEIVVDEELIKKDPLKARLDAKRKGNLIRHKKIDGEESRVEHSFEV